MAECRNTCAHFCPDLVLSLTSLEVVQKSQMPAFKPDYYQFRLKEYLGRSCKGL